MVVFDLVFVDWFQYGHMLHCVYSHCVVENYYRMIILTIPLLKDCRSIFYFGVLSAGLQREVLYNLAHN